MWLEFDDPRVIPRAPWSWGTDDRNLAQALEYAMKAAGVREELCTVVVGDREGIRREKYHWLTILEEMETLMGPKCNSCKEPSQPDGTSTLLSCGACKKVKYCSTACQKKDWKQHTIICKFYAKDPSVKALDYYTVFASQVPEAQQLAREIGLTLPGRGASQRLM